MDYGHDLRFGAFITPTAADPQVPVTLAQIAEAADLDLVTFQDHPYQPAFLDTWTLMSYVAAATERVHIAPNVLNVPLRPPAVLAGAAASLDLLSGGRLDLGLGAGGFWDAIEAMGTPKLTPGQAVTALAEAIEIIRGRWDTSQRGGLFTDGTVHAVHGVKRGPRPGHEIPIWLGARRPRMLALIGRSADGWLPSLPWLEPGDYARGNARIDEAAEAAGRDPRAIRRLLNVGASPKEARAWAEELAGYTLADGVSTFIAMADDPRAIQRFGTEVAPAVRELVARERAARGTAPAPTRSRIALSQRRPGIDYDAVPSGVRAIEPGDFDYADVANTYMRGGRPGLILQPTDAAGVSRAIGFAAQHPDVPLSVRSGGHGISGRSTNDGGIVIDLRRLNAIEVLDPARRLVRIGAGARWAQVAAALGEHGWALSSGDYGGVGVGGLATAGGIGWLAREHGLTIDHVRAVEVALADGSIRRVDADHDPDLFWAMRGAGANMGIAVSFDFQIDEVGEVGWAQLVFDASDTAAFLEGWGAAVQAAPRDLTSFLILSPARGGQPVAAYVMAMIDSDDADTIIERLQPFAQLAPLVQQSVQLTTYPQVMANADLGPQQGAGEPVTRSALIDDITPELAAAVAQLLATGATHFFSIRAVGGAVADVPDDATAYAHRSASFSVATFGADEARLAAAWADIATHSRGLYLSFETSLRPERIEEAYPPATLERLRAVKARVDPAGLFRDNFAIGAAPAVTG
ncbi:LLM class flavin-dependent oxidoreductase [Microbacterium sp. 10M-3C3]|uniref:LLM class flavin-dependent oxidoreductase n=1 Tax=Microbacterium sp. 10M-3C3 TaxID=2483401 RepID=UPI000F63C47C|nr:LLM class flavin-dependent oxidoreductase [Microbacterium sp. 10M-3C3]